MLRRSLLAVVAALTVFYYFFFGAGPSPSEYVEDLPWWRPWGTALHWPPLMGLAEMARAGFPRAWVPILLGCAPPVALALLGGRVLRSALARAVLVFLCAMMCVFVYYGLRAEQVWRFFEWRFAAVSASFCAVVVAIAFSAQLFDQARRLSRALAWVLALAACAGVFLLSTEVTGTSSSMPFNISPWPIVTLFGFLLAGAQIAALVAATGAASWVRTRVAGRATGVLGGLAAAAGVAAVAGWFVFSAPRGRVFLVVLALACAAAGALRRQLDPETAALRGARSFAAGALILVAILGSAQVAASLQRRARDVTALVVLDALEAYKKDNSTYPDKLDALVPKYLAEIPRPQIGLIRDEDDRFSYSNYGDSYALEFASVLWVQCQYSPPYEFAAADPDEKEELPDVPTKGDTPDVAAAKEPSEDDAALKATLAQHGLNGSWSCPKEPPKLW